MFLHVKGRRLEEGARQAQATSELLSSKPHKISALTQSSCLDAIAVADFAGSDPAVRHAHSRPAAEASCDEGLVPSWRRRRTVCGCFQAGACGRLDCRQVRRKGVFVVSGTCVCERSKVVEAQVETEAARNEAMTRCACPLSNGDQAHGTMLRAVLPLNLALRTTSKVRQMKRTE